MGEKLYFKFGVMGAAKTAEALMCKFRYEEVGKKVIFCKPSLDTRDGKRRVESRIGLSADNVLFLEEVLMVPSSELRADVIIVDEAQFATAEQVDKLGKICDEQGIPVICYGLKTDFRGRFFEGSKRLFETADKLEEIKQICWCGRKALFNARVTDGKIIKEGKQVVVGGNDKYVSLCRKHYNLGQLSENGEKEGRFSSPEEMYELIKSGTDLYNPRTERLISVYNDSGSIIEHGNINQNKAKELILSCRNAGYDEFEWVIFLSGGYIYDSREYAEENSLRGEYTAYDWCADSFSETGWVSVQEYIKSISEKTLISSPEEMRNTIYRGTPIYCPARNTLITTDLFSSESLIVFTGHEEENIALSAEECRKEGLAPEEWHTRILADSEITALENTLEVCRIYFEGGEDWYSLPDYLLALKEWEIRFMYDGTYYIRTITALSPEEARVNLINSIDTSKEYAVLSISEKK